MAQTDATEIEGRERGSGRRQASQRSRMRMRIADVSPRPPQRRRMEESEECGEK